MTELIPGKRYTSNMRPYNSEFFIGYTSKGGRMWENSQGCCWYENDCNRVWTEFKEPKVHKGYVVWYQSALDGQIHMGLYMTQKYIDMLKNTVIVNTQEVSWTET